MSVTVTWKSRKVRAAVTQITLYICERATPFHTPRPVNSGIGETRGYREPRDVPFTYRWKLNAAYRRNQKREREREFVKFKVRRRKLAARPGPIAVGDHLSGGALQTVGKRERDRLRSSCQTEANQTKPKPERLGTNQLSQAHPQLAKRQTYLIQLLSRARARASKSKKKRGVKVTGGREVRVAG